MFEGESTEGSCGGLEGEGTEETLVIIKKKVFFLLKKNLAELSLYHH